jgi:DNA-binding NtrC family response regulator
MEEPNEISIVIVDDEQVFCDLLSKTLKRAGYQVRTTNDSAKALEMLSRQKAEVVITDVKLPQMDGFELLKEVKSCYPDTAVIVTTAYSDTYSIKDAMLKGADEYLTKPFKGPEITMVVERAYWRKKSSQRTAGKPE